jgi:16S rRNA processing protein RimM
MTVEAPSALVVGQLSGVFGVKGWLKVKSFTQPEENILQYTPWRLRAPSGLQVVEVDDYQMRPQGLVVHFKGLDDRDEAALIARLEIEVDKSELPELQQGDYYWHQLMGLTVITDFLGRDQILGQLTDILETGANDVLVVAPGTGSIDQRERLVPYVPDVYVKSVDLTAREIRVWWDPEF